MIHLGFLWILETGQLKIDAFTMVHDFCENEKRGDLPYHDNLLVWFRGIVLNNALKTRNFLWQWNMRTLKKSFHIS